LKKADLTVQRLETDEDIEQYFELMRNVFGEEAGVDKLAKKLIDYHPTMTLKDFFVIKHKGRIVSTINLIPVTWSIGGILLRVAEMGNVATLPEYRGKGLIRRLVDEFHKEVKDQAYDLAIIEGIPYFYRQFGYEYAVPLLEEIRMRLDQIPDGKSKIKIRPFTQKDIPRAMKLLAQSQRKFHVHSVRDKAVWEMQEKTSIASDPEPFQAFAVEEERKLIAYFRMRENPKEKELILTEITEVDQLAAQAILVFLKNFGVQRGLEILSAHISYEEPLTEHLVALGAVKRIPTYAWQVRITDCLRIFQKLKPLFESRLAASMYHRLTETLSFNFRLFTVQMTVREGMIVRIRKVDTGERSPIGLNPSVFVQLLMGYRSRQELEATFPDVRIDVSRKHLIDVLFLKLPSYIHSAY
jgi:predicted acetyltransferase